MIRVYRVQDREGRGPFRPGFSREWADETFNNGTVAMPTWMEEFGSDLIDRSGHAHEHFGTAVRTIDQLCKWFSPTERARLAVCGYNVVSLAITRVLAESDNQLVFARRRPLHHGVIIVPWPI